ncbi:MAG: hypothetical protein JW819_13965 [Candidatus Krumholzibacteriota bacterium]|nr:hypothetical protein [Candidatus Krumholzibacteriota bacterium]
MPASLRPVRAAALAALLILAACIKERIVYLDVTPPAVSIVQPAADDEVSGLVTITALAEDAEGVVSVAFYVDGELLGVDEAAPWEQPWQAGFWSEGETHWLLASAEDPRGNLGVSDSIPVTLAAGASLVPAPLAPADGGDLAGYEAVLTWASLAAAAEYEAQAALAADFAAPVFAALTADTTATLQALLAGRYYWRVRAQDGEGHWTAWSAVRNVRQLQDWCRVYGGDGDDRLCFAGSAGDGAGYLLAGTTSSAGAGGDDFWLVRTDLDRVEQWSRTFGGAGDEIARAASIQPAGNVLIAGSTDSEGAGNADLWLQLADPAGGPVWSRAYGGPGDDTALDVRFCEGGWIACGSRTTPAGDTDAWLLRLDAAGDTLWTRSWGGAGDDAAHGVRGYANTGWFVAGSTASFGAGGPDLWVIYTDAVGDSLWTHRAGGAYWDEGLAVSLSATDSGCLAAGYNWSASNGGPDLWLVKLGPDGAAVWDRLYGSPGVERANAVVQGASGLVLAAGETDASGSYDGWLLHTAANGDSLWARRWGGVGDDRILALGSAGSAGNLLAGSTRSFGAGGRDGWLLLVDWDGELQP